MKSSIQKMQTNPFYIQDLENFVRKNLNQISDSEQLMILLPDLIFQLNSDLLALDKNGRLYIFELKREPEAPTALLKILSRATLFSGDQYQKLNSLVSQMSRSDVGLDRLHASYFHLENPLPRDSFNGKICFILIADSDDDDVAHSVEHWKNQDVDIEILPYFMTRQGGEFVCMMSSFNSLNLDE